MTNEDISNERISELTHKVNQLLFLLNEEFTANGGTFISMETDILFKRLFWSPHDISNRACLDRLQARAKLELY